METSSLHSPIVRRTIETLNAGQLDDFMAVFTSDATVVDEATYQGYDAIRAWTERENFRVHMHIDVVREKDAQGLIVEAQAASQGGYSGPATLSFTLQDNLIKRLVIS